MKLTIDNEAALPPLAQKLAAVLTGGDVVFLSGDLGAGKTALARVLIRELTGNPDEEVPSPTFTLVQTYDTKRGTLWHFDLYRLKTPEEIIELGWEEALPSGIILVEWPQRLGYLAPRDRLEVRIDGCGTGPRTVELIPHGAWKERKL